jgi:hypothetical protein
LVRDEVAPAKDVASLLDVLTLLRGQLGEAPAEVCWQWDALLQQDVQ